MLESGRLHRPNLNLGHLAAGSAGVAIAALLAVAEPASAQIAEGQPGQSGAAAPPSIGKPPGGVLSFAVMANMVNLTEVVSSSVALLAGTTSCDSKANLAYNGVIENNNWNVRLTGTYADRLVTLDYNGSVSSVHHMGRFEGAGAFGDATWISSGSVAFTPSGEFMSLAGYVRTDAATPVWEWDANWLMSKPNERAAGPTPLPPTAFVATDSASAINVFKQQNRPLIIIDIFGTWRHSTYWLHSVIIVIVFFDAATGQQKSCRVNIQESGVPISESHFRVEGVATVDPSTVHDMSER
jgi:hypothetical protein